MHYVTRTTGENISQADRLTVGMLPKFYFKKRHPALLVTKYSEYILFLMHTNWGTKNPKQLKIAN